MKIIDKLTTPSNIDKIFFHTIQHQLAQVPYAYEQ
jgi:hypothetical protein